MAWFPTTLVVVGALTIFTGFVLGLVFSIAVSTFPKGGE